MMDGAAVRNAAPAAAETVRWRAWGAPAAAFVAGGIIGGALAAPYYYDYGYGPYYPSPYYGGPYAAAPAYAAPAYDAGGDETYCMQRFKSYDPTTGTYLGYDGRRHPCR
jgi:hypothetical protein